MKKLYIILSLLALVSCEKELEIDYHTVEPMLVVEGGVTDWGSDVRLTLSQNLDDPSGAPLVKDAKVVITSLADGSSSQLFYDHAGHYQSEYAGVPGNSYQLDIWYGDKHFTSQSRMPKAPQITYFGFQWQEMMGMRFVMADLRFLDPPDEENYYVMYVSKNGVYYRWTVIRDNLNPGGEIQQVFGCMSEDDAKEDAPEDQDDILHDGDVVNVILGSIDRTVYDYLYALQLSGHSSSNPVSNITGGCLGCFWAGAVDFYECTYQTNEVKDE